MPAIYQLKNSPLDKNRIEGYVSQRRSIIKLDNDISNITKWLIDGLYPKDICEKLHFC